MSTIIDNDDLKINEDGRFTMLPNKLFGQGRFLSLEAKWVYTALKSFENNDDGRCYPSYVKIKRRSGLNDEQISEGLKELERFYWIKKKKHFDKSTDYILVNPVVYTTSEHIAFAEDQTCPTKEQARIYKKQVRKEKANKPSRRGKETPFETIERLKQTAKQRAIEESDFDDSEIPF